MLRRKHLHLGKNFIPILFITAWLVVSGAAIEVFGQQDDVNQSGDSHLKVFRAGAATSNITPPLGEPIVGGWSPIPATYIHDELHARCLVLDDGATQLAIVLCDNVGIPREVFDFAKPLIEEATELTTERILLASTHTHSAAAARGPSKVDSREPLSDYQKFIARRISDGVRRAVSHLEPAMIGWGSVEEQRHVFNRRWYMKPGPELRNPFGGVDQVRMNPPRNHPDLLRPAGPTDPEVSFVSVQAVNGRPIAILANYSLHYVGGVPAGHISADYFAVFADRIQELLDADRLDPPFVGILSNGTSGDVNNINFQASSERLKPYEKIKIVAGHVAAKVNEAHQHLEFYDWVPLSSRQRELTLEVRKPTEEQLAYLIDVRNRPKGSQPFHVREQVYAERVLSRRDSPDEVKVVLQTFRIGELGIAAIPFEVFVQTGLEIKEKCPLENAFTIELANGSYGYLPTPEQHELGGYETWLGTNNVEKNASTKIVQNLMEMFEELKIEGGKN